MRSSNREEIVEAFDALNAGMSRVLALDTEVLTTGECLAMLERCETVRRQLPAIEHPMVNRLATADAAELGAKPPVALANRLRITRAEASRRIGDAADLGPRHTLAGEPLQPVLPATAAAQRAGHLSTEHARVIRGFFERLPAKVDLESRVAAEADLAEYAHTTRPDELSQLAATLTDCLNPDGDVTDVDRARRRTLLLGKQDTDGMSPIRGWLDPEARATLDAVLARWAAPGMCNPNDPTPCVSGTPSQDAIQSDNRSAGQRNHDALTALGRAMLASGDLGHHNGLPATIIVTTTLDQLEAAAGTALTGGGTRLPMSDVIRLASHARHYLRIYQGAKELALYHTKRIASPGQRIVLYAKDRGCSFPHCDVPGYLTQAHHITGFAITQDTDINDLTLACGPHHKLVGPGGWTTRTNTHGHTEWIPPPHSPASESYPHDGQPQTNNFHHPERLLHDYDDDHDP